MAEHPVAAVPGWDSGVPWDSGSEWPTAEQCYDAGLAYEPVPATEREEVDADGATS
jgi:hypothetical protein